MINVLSSELSECVRTQRLVTEVEMGTTALGELKDGGRGVMVLHRRQSRMQCWGVGAWACDAGPECPVTEGGGSICIEQELMGWI